MMFPSVFDHPLRTTAVAGVLADCRRILRDGGRLIAIEPGSASGLAAIFKRRPPGGAAAESATARALEGAGFQPVRVLADREGYRFTEAIKGQQR